MYPPNPPKAPSTIRPRSSLSAAKKPSNALLTLAGFCVFLFVLCAFLLGALVYVGRTIAENATTMQSLPQGSGIFIEPINQTQHVVLSTKPILQFRPLDPISTIAPESTKRNTSYQLSEEIMSTSKILKEITYRLPREIKPQRYNLRLYPNLPNKTFNGSVTITLEVLKPISFIPIHAKLINVTTESVLRLNKAGAEISAVEPSMTFAHPQYEYWITEFAKPLESGNYSILLNFNGSLTDKIVGFYQSSYFDKNRNEKRWIATSKFEPTYARQAFPCFDEPSMKAQFTIRIVRPTDGGYHALSNMEVENEEVKSDGLTEVTFAESVPMSTYLACFIVSDFDYQEKLVKGTLENAPDFNMRVYSTPAQKDKLEYALKIGSAITEYYIEYFNVPYPLNKLDMVAIPDFVSGAMENWGLVTFRETALLYDPTISSSANQQRVATVIAHELAHMWFGNLVTMKWWNDLWLNEGFASYIEYKGVHKVEPTWSMLDQFLIADFHSVMKLDATTASHPIVQTVESPSQITELFDSITYSKGASIIRMLEDLVGEEKFQKGTTNYLNNNIYGNAVTEDYINEIEALGFEFDVKLLLETWTDQMGFPVVSVVRSGNTFTLTQKRFFSNPEDYNTVQDPSTFNYHWSIPITYVTDGESEKQSTIFNYNDNQLTLTISSVSEWIKFNKNQMGYYLVNYDENMWQALITLLLTERGKLSISDRANLVFDVFTLADASQLDYNIAFQLSTYLQKERDYVPWQVGASRLNAIKSLLYYTEFYRDFTVYVRKIVTEVYETLTWEEDTDHLLNMLRVTILNTACRFGHKVALQEAATRFNAWLINPDVRPTPNLRSIVYYYGMQAVGTEEIWDQVLALFVAESDAQEKIKLMEALAAIKEPWILQRYINLAWDESIVRSQDYFSCLQYISRNPVGQSLVWDHVRENWQRLVDRFGINERTLGRLIPAITSQFSTQTKLEEMEAFFAKYPEAGAGTAARREALATVRYNIKWLEHNIAKVGNWLQENNQQIE
ncbi:glutamyl aminopeptidase-like isoform X1 [Teleopsis dalmanni]|uniref:glutamyl aminopeptidase-like isoform X1 n=1 Tax=Teleopsis dalmanni TaxID=139649 RepID=UPI0018CCA602|nr:glutamyl aminopeptidase-like isoform X1 [Teleopsis dalmanni]XP_037953764.1 glutamyl aminopeptidase-like isoform X1 [Teleopsis dalmanni]